MFTKLREFLQGKKTYIVSIIAILTAIMKYTADGNTSELIFEILAATGLISLKAGINRKE